MPKIPPAQIAFPLVPFTEISGKSKRQVRKDSAEGKYKSVAGGSCHMIPIDSEIAAGIASQKSARRFSTRCRRMWLPKKSDKSIPYNVRVQKPGRDRAETPAAGLLRGGGVRSWYV